MTPVQEAPDGWDGILDPGEVIVWQGVPDTGIKIEWDSVFSPLMYLFFIGFSIVWMNIASQAGGYFWTFGLIFFGIGLYNLLGIHVYKALERGKTHYTLSSKRGYIAKTSFFGNRKLESHTIASDFPLRLEERGALSSVYFASKTVRGQKRSYTLDVGFELITDGRDVLSLLRKIQDQEAQA